jgi:hypothetical protein
MLESVFLDKKYYYLDPIQIFKKYTNQQLTNTPTIVGGTNSKETVDSITMFIRNGYKDYGIHSLNQYMSYTTTNFLIHSYCFIIANYYTDIHNDNDVIENLNNEFYFLKKNNELLNTNKILYNKHSNIYSTGQFKKYLEDINIILQELNLQDILNIISANTTFNTNINPYNSYTFTERENIKSIVDYVNFIIISEIEKNIKTNIHEDEDTTIKNILLTIIEYLDDKIDMKKINKTINDSIKHKIAYFLFIEFSKKNDPEEFLHIFYHIILQLLSIFDIPTIQN